VCVRGGGRRRVNRRACYKNGAQCGEDSCVAGTRELENSRIIALSRMGQNKVISIGIEICTSTLQADALTTAELDEYRQQVRDKLQQAASRAGRPIIHAFTPEELKAAGDADIALHRLAHVKGGGAQSSHGLLIVQVAFSS